MKKETFDWFICLTSAPLAGIGLAQLNYGSIGWGMVCTALSIKLIVSYFRTPREMFEKDNFEGSLTEFNKRLNKYLEKVDDEWPILAWLTSFSTYFLIGGVILVILENI